MPAEHPDAPLVPSPASPDLRRRCPLSPPQDYEELRDNGQLGTFRLPDDSLAWLITSYADATRVLGDRRFGSGANMASLGPEEGDTPGWLFGLDAPEHTRLRRLFTPHFTARALSHMEIRITALAGERLDAMLAAGAPADLFKEFLWPLPRLVVYDLLDVPSAQQDDFERRLAVGDDPAQPLEERLGAFRNVWRAMVAFARERRHGHGDDLIGQLLRADGEEGPLTVEEAASLMLSLRLGGQAPVAHTLAMGIFMLLQRDGGLGTIPIEDDASLDSAVEELLRHVPSNNLGIVRTARQDVPLGDHTIPAGHPVFVNLPVADRDPARWPAPDDLDVKRAHASHLAFGYGAHRCLGHHLARLELRVMLRELLTRCPQLRLAVDPADVRREITATTFGVAELPVSW
ncbi:cytochrome P450 [Streptomyces sp. CL12]|uniref:cytochrome P450 n=1 Tax=Streptomyces sp. CL12 TaxID=3391744 RepID=UPI003A802660